MVHRRLTAGAGEHERQPREDKTMSEPLATLWLT
jgi:hypothetical protein